MKNGWVTDLDNTEKKIRAIDEEKMPEIEESIDNLKKKLNESLESMSFDWKNGSSPEIPS